MNSRTSGVKFFSFSARMPFQSKSPRMGVRREIELHALLDLGHLLQRGQDCLGACVPVLLRGKHHTAAGVGVTGYLAFAVSDLQTHEVVKDRPHAVEVD